MKEKEYKEEIIRLENVLLEKESTIQYLWEGKQALYEEVCSLRQKLEENKTPSFYELWKKNNKAIYNALIRILELHIYDKNFKDWNVKEKEMIKNNKIIIKTIKQLKEERNLNND